MIVNRPKRITGFMERARGVVLGWHGLTAQEVYKQVAEMAKATGHLLSAAANPENSLVATLHKHHTQYGLVRRMEGGRYRFYPAQPSPSQVPPAVTPGRNCCFELPPEEAKQVKALVDLGRYESPHQAHLELIRLGLRFLLSKLSG